MDVSQVTATISTPNALQATVASNRDKIADDIEKSELIQTQPDDGQQKDSFTVEEMEELSNQINHYMDYHQTSLRFFIQKGSDNQLVAEIRNRKTDEIIRQLPSEELLKIKEMMAELTGLIVDRRI